VRTSAGLIESDLARAFTHTLASSRTEMVDRQRATSILAAGSEAVIPAPDLHFDGTAVRRGPTRYEPVTGHPLSSFRAVPLLPRWYTATLAG
jgi:hypothetical protein